MRSEQTKRLQPHHRISTIYAWAFWVRLILYEYTALEYTRTQPSTIYVLVRKNDRRPTKPPGRLSDLMARHFIMNISESVSTIGLSVTNRRHFWHWTYADHRLLWGGCHYLAFSLRIPQYCHDRIQFRAFVLGWWRHWLVRSEWVSRVCVCSPTQFAESDILVRIQALTHLWHSVLQSDL